MACSKATLISFALILLAVVYQYYKPKDSIQNKDSSTRKIAIGLNADVDYIISAVELLKSLSAPLATGETTAHPVITTIDELQETVAYSMATCSGIERHFSDGNLFDEIVKRASKMKHEEYIGGNAALMAVKMSQLAPDTQILLTGPIGPKLNKYINSANIRTVSPKTTREEVHIIMEYAKGEDWGVAKATCANRVIISHDKENSGLTSLEEFGSTLKSFNPNVVVFTGAHMLDGQPREVWEQRIKDISNLLKGIPRHVLIHFELATIGNLEFMKELADQVLPHVDSLGLNEQELLSIAKSKEANFTFETIGAKPAIPDACDLLFWLFDAYSALNRNDSRLTRIHFHSLTYHVVVSPKKSLSGTTWANGLYAVTEGSKIASLQACDVDEITPTLHELQIPKKFPLSNNDERLHKSVIEYHPENGYVAWLRNEVEFKLSPVYVCKKPLKTVGLGDAISATGLLKQEFTYKEPKKR